MTNKEQNVSVLKIVMSYFAGLITFLIVDLIFVFIFTLLVGIIYSIPIKLIRGLLTAFFFIRGDNANWLILIMSALIASFVMDKIVSIINKNNSLQCSKTLWGIGLTFIVWGAFCAICNLIYSDPITGNVVIIIIGAMQIYTSHDR